MKIGQSLKSAREFLNMKGIEDPSREAGLLLSWALKKDLGYLFTHPDMELSENEQNSLLQAVEKRGRNEPFSYITGEVRFYDLPFNVNSNVLIPRGDTELLVEAALTAIGRKPAYFNQGMFTLPIKEKYKVLDIGTGSGCVAVTIARNSAESSVDAIDISDDALLTAHNNASMNKVEDRVSFYKIDFLKDISILKTDYDLVVSNPPYIPSKDISGLMPSVRDYEPHSALDGGEDGLIFYRTISENARKILTPGGILAVECGFDQAEDICALFRQSDMEILILKDLSGIDRVIVSRFL